MNEIMESFLSDLTVLDVYLTDEFIVLRVALRNSGNHCPMCGQWATRDHRRASE